MNIPTLTELVEGFNGLQLVLNQAKIESLEDGEGPDVAFANCTLEVTTGNEVYYTEFMVVPILDEEEENPLDLEEDPMNEFLKKLGALLDGHRVDVLLQDVDRPHVPPFRFPIFKMWEGALPVPEEGNFLSQMEIVY